jgi:hypothetical protein
LYFELVALVARVILDMRMWWFPMYPGTFEKWMYSCEPLLWHYRNLSQHYCF